MDTDKPRRIDPTRGGSPFLNTETAAAYLSLSPRYLRQLRREGRGPRYRRHARYVRYHIDDLDSWSEDISERNT